MKRLMYSVGAAIVALTTIFMTGCGISEERQHTLKVYNWGDYIDEDLITEFEEWYKEQTGEEVTIIYQNQCLRFDLIMFFDHVHPFHHILKVNVLVHILLKLFLHFLVLYPFGLLLSNK